MATRSSLSRRHRADSRLPCLETLEDQINRLGISDAVRRI